MSEIDIPRAGVAPIDQQGSALLAGLIGFIYPIVFAECRPPSDSQRALSELGMDVADLCSSDKGRLLLKSLGQFVALIIDTHTKKLSTEEKGIEEAISHAGRNQTSSSLDNNITDKDNDAEYRDDALLTSMQMSIPKPVPTQELPSTITDKVYDHVFNQMPIRVLAFDLNGTQLELLERSAIATHIISCIHDAYRNGLDGEDEDELVNKFSRYAILSHTWIRGTPGEVVYQDWEARNLLIHSRGYSKILKFCEVAALKHGVTFGWMDTVCINKNSSSELDESIRSMYKWYKSAHVCVTFLAETLRIKDMHLDPWFTRGWTLQELVAPRVIKFYNQDWQALVSHHHSTPTLILDDQKFNRDFEDTNNFFNIGRSFGSDIPVELQYQIFKATSITRAELRKFHARFYIPLSRIMQLASHRKVTRDEDSIYSLMGLLGVSIPIAYGEGSLSAFRRIIREIIALGHVIGFMDLFHHHNSHSIIPVHITDYMERSSVFSGIFLNTLNTFRQPEPVMLTHMGVRLTLVAVPAFRKDIFEQQIPLKCRSYSFSIPEWQSGSPSMHYIVLDNSKYSATWASNLNLSNYSGEVSWSPAVIFMAVLGSNVRSRDGTYQLSVSKDNTVCIGIRSFNKESKTLADLETREQFSGPREILIPYSSSSDQDGVVRIPQKKGDQLGLRSLTMYFR